MKELSDIISIQNRVISDKLYAGSIGKGPLQVKM